MNAILLWFSCLGWKKAKDVIMPSSPSLVFIFQAKFVQKAGMFWIETGKYLIKVHTTIIEIEVGGGGERRRGEMRNEMPLLLPKQSCLSKAVSINSQSWWEHKC